MASILNPTSNITEARLTLEPCKLWGSAAGGVKRDLSDQLFSAPFTPASQPELSPAPWLLDQIFNHSYSDHAKCIFNVEQCSSFLILCMVYKSAMHFCGVARVHLAAQDGLLPGGGRCCRRSWAELVFLREKCSKVRSWLVSTHLICRRLLAVPWMQCSLRSGVGEEIIPVLTF